MNYAAEIFTSTIVALGHFNPAIFTPDWLERNGLIGSGDADGIRESTDGRQIIISNQATSYESDWFGIQVLEDKITLSSKGALSPAFKDLAAGIFQLVPHTPMIAVGMNFLGHFKIPSQEQYHQIGDLLAPKDIWNKLYPEETPGLGQLVIRIQKGTRDKPAQTKNEKRISVQQSAAIKFGIFFSYNDHHELTEIEDHELQPAEHAVRIIDQEWEPAWHDALRVFDGVLTATIGA